MIVTLQGMIKEDKGFLIYTTPHKHFKIYQQYRDLNNLFNLYKHKLRQRIRLRLRLRLTRREWSLR